MSNHDIPVKASIGGTYCYTERDKQRIRTYVAKYAHMPPHERFYAVMRIKTAIMNGHKLDDE